MTVSEVLAEAIKRTSPLRDRPSLCVLTDVEADEFRRLPRIATEAIRLRCIQRDLKPRDLVPFLGHRSRVSEVCSGKREPSKSQIRSLHCDLGIPLEHLLELPERKDTP